MRIPICIIYLLKADNLAPFYRKSHLMGVHCTQCVSVTNKLIDYYVAYVI